VSASATGSATVPRRAPESAARWLLPASWRIPGAGLGWLAASLLLLAIGLATVYSASFYRALIREGDEFHFLAQQLLGAGLGLAALAVAARIDPRRWIDHAPTLYLGTLALLILVWSPIGIESGGAHRWVDLQVVGVQSSELAKLSVPLLLVWYLRRYGDLSGASAGLRIHVSILLLGSLFLVVGLVLIEPDLGTAAFLLAVGLMVILCSGMPLRALAALGVLGVPLLVWQLRDRWELVETRLLGVTDPELVPQVHHALTAIRAGGLDGAGLGRGTEKTLFLFAEFSDFIFAVYAEETGFRGIGLLVILYAALLVFGWRIVVACRDRHLRLVGLAIVCNLVFQAILNLAVNTAMAPTKGIALPFISHGSTGLSLALLQVGILLAISRTASAERGEEVTA
jgi:cell division protein FtsW